MVHVALRSCLIHRIPTEARYVQRLVYFLWLTIVKYEIFHYLFKLTNFSQWASMDCMDDSFQSDSENLKFRSLLSPRNGITLSIDAQHMFDSYQIAFDVDVRSFNMDSCNS